MSSQSKNTWLVVGLGNPGDKYSATRHNIGFVVADELAIRCGGKFTSSKYRALVSEVRLGMGSQAPKLVIVKPQTYMNDSGDAVSPLAKYFNTPAEQIIAIHDELDIPFNTIRVKIGGGDNGHNGLKSLTSSFSTADYFRIRMGIGRPIGDQDPADFVLKPFSKEERKDLGEFTTRGADAITALVLTGMDKAQTAFNS